MAVVPFCVSSTVVAICKSAPTRRGKPAANRVLVRSGSNASINNMSMQESSSSSENKIKVFEDKSKGIVCYRDENGEITCEGYDEGPRFCQQFHKFSCNSRESEIIDLLQRCWLQVIDDAEM
nr:uncharacterized protein LOC109192516 [Ipomoea batatas]GMD33694.1 uncharacterized protein LOC109192516 [Ipomoea batatas]